MADNYWIDPDDERELLQQADTQRLRAENMRAQVTEDVAQRVVALTQSAPNASPGLVQAGARAGMPEEQFKQVAATDDGGNTFVDSALGFVGKTFEVAGDVLDAAYDQVVKPTIRGAFTVLEGAAEEIVQRPATALWEGAFNPEVSVGEAYDQYGNSAAVELFQSATGQQELELDPEEGSLGHGFFPGGAIGEEAESQRRLTINGQKATLGRALTADTFGHFMEPGETAYNTVAGVTQFAIDVLTDPVAWATGGGSTAARVASKMGASGKALTAIEGGVAGLAKARRQIDKGEVARIFNQAGAVMTKEKKAALPEKFAQVVKDPDLLGKLEDASPYDLYQSVKRSPANHFSRDLYRAMRSDDGAEIAERFLSDVQKGYISERGIFSGPTAFRKRRREWKLGGISPSGMYDPNDMETFTDKLDSLLRQAEMPRDVRERYFNRVLDIEDGDIPGSRQVLEDAMDEIAESIRPKLAEVGVDAEDLDFTVSELVRLADGEVHEFRQYAIFGNGDPVITPFTKTKQVPVNGNLEEVPVPTPTISSQIADTAFYVPDVTDIRRAATKSAKLRKVYNNAGWKLGTDALRKVTRQVFKPLAILRPAYVMRIGPEEQARLTGWKMDSLLNHPFRFLMANVAYERALKKLSPKWLRNLAPEKAKEAIRRRTITDLTGEDLFQRAEALHIVGREVTGVMDDAVRSRSHVWGQTAKGETLEETSGEFFRGWRDELGQMSAAPEMRELARNGGRVDEWMTWARDTDEGREAFERLATINDEAKGLLENDEALEAYGRTLSRWLDDRTSLDGDLLDMIAEGKPFQGAPGNEARLTRLLQDKFDKAPVTVRLEKANDVKGPLKDMYDRALEVTFDVITTRPTSYFSRFPAFRQKIVENLGDMMVSAKSDELRREIVERAGKSLNLTKKERRVLERKASEAAGTNGIIDTLDEMNEIAVTRSASQVKDILFDVNTKSAAQDALDLWFPFLDAWEEVTINWARLVKENPAFFIKAQAGFRSLETSGVFYNNEFGDKVFTYPGGGILGQALAGTDEAGVRLEGRLEGLNLVAQGVGPGFGPVIQWGAGTFVPDTEDFQRLREFISPFGYDADTPSDLTNPMTYIQSLMPSWAEKGINAWTKGDIDPVQWNSMVGEAMQVMATAGPYDPGDPRSQQQLIKDAESGARWLLFLRSFLQSTAPTGPSATWQLREGEAAKVNPKWEPERDPDGTWHTVGVMAQEYYRMLEEFDYDSELATARFFEMYGHEPYYISQSKTKTIGNLPVSKAGDFWIAKHKGAAERYPEVIGYLVPPTEQDAAFDYSVWRKQIETGQRQTLTAKQQVQLANQKKARQMLYAVQKRVEPLPSSDQERVLSIVRSQLEEKYPGWSHPVPGVAQGRTTSEKIDRLAEAVQDPQLTDAKVAAPLKAYFTVRQAAYASARQRGFSTLNNEASKDLRAALRRFGTELARAKPAFTGVWSQLLQREVEA